MDLSTTPRRATDGVVGDLQKTRVAKSVFSIRSLVDVEETELPVQDDELSPSESLDDRNVDDRIRENCRDYSLALTCIHDNTLFYCKNSRRLLKYIFTNP